MRQAFAVLSLLCCLAASAAEVIPPKPPRYFNDFAGVVPRSQADQLNRQLEDFERATSSQILVAVFPKMQSGSSIEDYANRVFRAWEVGQKDKNNGAVLFVFTQDRRLRIEVGYGLEGVLPDATCKRIIADDIGPRFRDGDFAGGLVAGVQAMLAAAKGEYRGSGRTVAETEGRSPVPGKGRSRLVSLVFFLILIATIIRAVRRAQRGMVYTGRGYRPVARHRSSWNWGGGAWLGGGGSSSWGGGGGWSSGGGGFSGGGGSSGGGGASGSW